jgi:YVTN family beta-propeller protein
MRFCVLGPLAVEADGRAIAVGGGRQRALLALLLVHAGEVVSRDRLIEELWAGESPASASQSLDAYLSRLRRALREAGAGDVLRTRAPGYVLEAGDTDVARFEALTAEGRAALAAGDPRRAAALLREGLALWRGSAYGEVADEPWARAEVGRLEDLRLAATELRVDADLAAGRHDELVPELEHLVARHPARERLVAQLMLALYRSGRQADALAAYRAARRTLVDELGLEPGPELRRLEHAVLAQDPALELRRPVSSGVPVPATRRSRRWLALGAAVIVGALVSTVVALSGGSGAARTVAANAAGALDPASGRITASIAVGSSPAGIAGGAGRVWVSNGADGTVTRIDPRGGHVDQTIAVGSSPAGLVFAAGAIWVANALDGSVSRIDPRAGRVVQTIAVGQRPVAVAAGAGAVWVACEDDDVVWRVDPESDQAVRTIPVGHRPAGITVGDGAVWVANNFAGTISRIDPNTNSVVATIHIGHSPVGVAVGDGLVWVTVQAP